MQKKRKAPVPREPISKPKREKTTEHVPDTNPNGSVDIEPEPRTRDASTQTEEEILLDTSTISTQTDQIETLNKE